MHDGSFLMANNTWTIPSFDLSLAASKEFAVTKDLLENIFDEKISEGWVLPFWNQIQIFGPVQCSDQKKTELLDQVEKGT